MRRSFLLLLETEVGGYGSDGVQATATQIFNPEGIFVDTSGEIIFADFSNNRIRKIDLSGVITTIAGTGVIGYSGDGGQATAAKLYHPINVCRDKSGNLIFSEYSNHVVRRIDAAGIITTIAGNGTSSFGGDGGPATAALLSYPVGILVDATNNIYIADANNQRIRKISSAGIITTVAGKAGSPGFSGDGGAATNASFNNPFGITFDPAGNLYIADQSNHRIRKVDAAGVITTIAGTGVSGFFGDGGAASAARFNTPTNVYFDPSGRNLYVGDRLNHCVRKITSGTITTIAGTGTVSGFLGDGGLATAARLNNVPQLVVTRSGDLYVSDHGNHRIRKISSGNRVPYFTRKKPVLHACQGIGAVSVDSLLIVNDSDVSQLLTWVLHTPPTHGAALTTYTVTSTGVSVTPLGSAYTPAAGYQGADSFKVKVDDGISVDIVTIYVMVDSLPVVAPISGPTTLSVGTSITLLNTTTGGVWSASNGNLTIGSSTGVATGISVGYDTISYTVTNACGSTAVTRVDTVVSGLGVENEMETNNTLMLAVSPNPAQGQININFSSPEAVSASIKIVDISGRNAGVVFNGDIQGKYNVKYNISELPRGIYMVVLQTSNGAISKKIEIR